MAEWKEGMVEDQTPALIGLIVNPIAGMGGSVGLKGTDGADILKKAIALGARPLAAERTSRTLSAMSPAAGKFSFIVPPGAMGAGLLDNSEFSYRIAVPNSDQLSGAAATRAAAKAIKCAGASLILFAGGDGTARDLLDALGDSLPLIGIPCGVKMYSGVFATSPETAGHLACDSIEKSHDTELVEVMDIDESAYRAGQLSAELFGYARCPRSANRLQGPKARGQLTHYSAVRSAAAELARNLQPGQIYLVGPGTSAKAILDVLEIEGTLLGVDALSDRTLIGRDLSATEVRAVTKSRSVCLILGVVGGQGYVLGRGNQQIPADVVRKTGRDGLIILSSEEKLAQLAGGKLLVDTGNPTLDEELEGFVRVHTGAGRRMIMQLSAGR